jgi:hypothetical protein
MNNCEMILLIAADGNKLKGNLQAISKAINMRPSKKWKLGG